METIHRESHGANQETLYLAKEESNLCFPPDRTALLVIDPVNDFLSEGGAGWEMTKITVAMNDVIGNLKRAIEGAVPAACQFFLVRWLIPKRTIQTVSCNGGVE
jgi:hypothetical protein